MYQRVRVSLKGAPNVVEVKENPLHKKNADIGTKKTVYSNAIYVEQEDAQSFEDQEEVRLFHAEIPILLTRYF